MHKKLYLENKNKSIEVGDRFEHVMALSLDASSDYRHGLIRCITSRKGNVEKRGYIDRSDLYHVEKNQLDVYEIKERLHIRNEKEIIQKLNVAKLDFLGLEDPDIWVDEKNGMKHVYFTIPLLDKKNNNFILHLGHAWGKNLDSLEMTIPVLMEENGF